MTTSHQRIKLFRQTYTCNKPGIIRVGY